MRDKLPKTMNICDQIFFSFSCRHHSSFEDLFHQSIETNIHLYGLCAGRNFDDNIMHLYDDWFSLFEQRFNILYEGRTEIALK